jgi:hypothetical protein
MATDVSCNGHDVGPNRASQVMVRRVFNTIPAQNSATSAIPIWREIWAWGEKAEIRSREITSLSHRLLDRNFSQQLEIAEHFAGAEHHAA